MDQFAPIRNQIRHAQIERSVYVADLIAEFLASATKKIMTLADSIGEGSQKRFHRNVFTFDA